MSTLCRAARSLGAASESPPSDRRERRRQREREREGERERETASAERLACLLAWSSSCLRMRIASSTRASASARRSASFRSSSRSAASRFFSASRSRSIRSRISRSRASFCALRSSTICPPRGHASRGASRCVAARRSVRCGARIIVGASRVLSRGDDSRHDNAREEGGDDVRRERRRRWV